MSRKQYSMSKAGLLNCVQKLHLTPGDVLICKDYETLKAIEGLGRVVNFTVPLVFSPQGVEKLSRQDLLNLLEQIEQAPAPPPSFESPAAPL